MLLMMAAGPAGEAPAFHGKLIAHCHGCKASAYVPAGCGGGCQGGCTGGCGGGCAGYGAGFSGTTAGTGSGWWGFTNVYGIYGRGYASEPAVVFTPNGTTNLNPPDGSEKAVLRVELPKDATLTVDGQLVPGSGTSRFLATPDLPAGRDFFYDLKAEIMVDNKPVVEEKRVIVRAGGDVKTSFPKLLAAAPMPGDTKVANK
jgi:uncharacterized protein (TIGR03000 family)